MMMMRGTFLFSALSAKPFFRCFSRNKQQSIWNQSHQIYPIDDRYYDEYAYHEPQYHQCNQYQHEKMSKSDKHYLNRCERHERHTRENYEPENNV